MIWNVGPVATSQASSRFEVQSVTDSGPSVAAVLVQDLRSAIQAVAVEHIEDCRRLLETVIADADVRLARALPNPRPSKSAEAEWFGALCADFGDDGAGLGTLRVCARLLAIASERNIMPPEPTIETVGVAIHITWKVPAGRVSWTVQPSMTPWPVVRVDVLHADGRDELCFSAESVVESLSDLDD